MTGHDTTMTVECRTCPVRELHCGDCMVPVLLDLTAPSVRVDHALDPEERAAVTRLVAGGPRRPRDRGTGPGGPSTRPVRRAPSARRGAAPSGEPFLRWAGARPADPGPAPCPARAAPSRRGSRSVIGCGSSRRRGAVPARRSPGSDAPPAPVGAPAATGVLATDGAAVSDLLRRRGRGRRRGRRVGVRRDRRRQLVRGGAPPARLLRRGAGPAGLPPRGRARRSSTLRGRAPRAVRCGPAEVEVRYRVDDLDRGRPRWPGSRTTWCARAAGGPSPPRGRSARASAAVGGHARAAGASAATHAVVAGTVPAARLARARRRRRPSPAGSARRWDGGPRPGPRAGAGHRRARPTRSSAARGPGRQPVAATTEGPDRCRRHARPATASSSTPRAYARLTPAGREVVLTHELAHVAVRATVPGRAAALARRGLRRPRRATTRADVPTGRLLDPLARRGPGRAGPDAAAQRPELRTRRRRHRGALPRRLAGGRAARASGTGRTAVRAAARGRSSTGSPMPTPRPRPTGPSESVPRHDRGADLTPATGGQRPGATSPG